jgi:Holliday junction resolvase RusA-like endonuclease
MYTPGETAAEEAVVLGAWRAQTNMERAPKGTPVAVTIEVIHQTKGTSLKGRPFTVKPDADNIAKAVLDALNGFAWEDDAQVTALKVYKRPIERGDADSINVCIVW